MTAIPLLLGLLLVCGLAAGLWASRYDVPRVAVYVLVGALFSPDLLGERLGLHVNDWAEPLTVSALGIVAYLIGGSMTLGQLRRLGKTILGTALGEALGAVVIVFIVVWLLGPTITGVSSLQLALALAAIAATTAPAGTVAILHQYHARGPLSNTLLGVVALDDALGIIIFSFVLAALAGESLWLGSGLALLEVAGSLALGAGTGWVLSRQGRRVKQSTLLLPLLLGVILIAVGLAQTLGLSPLLAAMTLGFVARQAPGASSQRLFTPVEYLEEAVFVVFFTLAGAHFQLGVFLQVSGLALLYFLGRSAGKLLGAALGAGLSGAPPNVVRWLGFGLIPQAGVAVGLALSLTHHPQLQAVSGPILNTVLATTLCYEIIGPFAARFALRQAGELGDKRTRRRA